jgi:hypothetical protein
MLDHPAPPPAEARVSAAARSGRAREEPPPCAACASPLVAVDAVFAAARAMLAALKSAAPRAMPLRSARRVSHGRVGRVIVSPFTVGACSR